MSDLTPPDDVDEESWYAGFEAGLEAVSEVADDMKQTVPAPKQEEEKCPACESVLVYQMGDDEPICPRCS